jgi:SNF2 family DNA or RNA helicase
VTERRWRLAGDALLLQSGSATEPVPAARIFAHAFRKPEEGLPPIDIDGVELSRVPVNLVLEVGYLAPKDMEPSCRVVAEHPNGTFSTALDDAFARSTDHFVHEGTWYPFAPGTLDRLRSTMLDAGIPAPGTIRLRQLLEIRNRARGDPNVRFRTDIPEDLTPGLPPGEVRITAALYPYQTRGVAWLRTLAADRIGGILADEMGLGKTLQIIALIASETVSRPALVIAPATLLENWRREINRFAPELDVRVHHGAERTGYPDQLSTHDCIVVSYETMVRDRSLFQMIDWGAAVLDEAQNIRNPDAARTVAVKGLSRRISIAVTGTPIENRLEDLWSLCDFAVPGYLGTRREFAENYTDSEGSAARLASIAGPFVLRRRVAEVAADLPTRIDIPQPLVPDDWMAEEYDSLRTRVAAEYGAAAGFAGLVRLRQFCTHPFLLSGSGGDPAAFSSKYARLLELLEEIVENREKVLLFTSFAGMVDLLVWDLPRRLGIHCAQVDGRTDVTERQNIVDDFSVRQEPAVLVLNPRAGGTGLNIVAANHVVHYNPEWNPATQDQASARAHRRGQTRPVTVHQLYYLSTVEEVMFDRLQRKRVLAEAAVPDTDAVPDRADIARALNLSPLSRSFRQ